MTREIMIVYLIKDNRFRFLFAQTSIVFSTEVNKLINGVLFRCCRTKVLGRKLYVSVIQKYIFQAKRCKQQKKKNLNQQALESRQMP